MEALHSSHDAALEHLLHSKLDAEKGNEDLTFANTKHAQNEKQEISRPLLGLFIMFIDCLLLNTTIFFSFFLLVGDKSKKKENQKMLIDHQPADTRKIPDP